MAVDEALLEAMHRLGYPILRFYGWTEPAASFGYFQKYAEVEQLTTLRPLIRRPTGGGIVPHVNDWTYSLVIPPHHEWYSLAATESYRRIHWWIQLAFDRLKVETELAPIAQKAQLGQCFVGHEQSDLLWRGRKIAGAAQRRRRDGLLIQGSVQPHSSLLLRADWEEAMRDAGSAAFGVNWRREQLDPKLKQRTLALMDTKYSRMSYNQRR
jgi:lipoate-protein ligase A